MLNMAGSKNKVAIVLYRLYEMIIWFIVLIVNIIWWFFIIVPYLFTGKDYISKIGRIHQKCLTKAFDMPIDIDMSCTIDEPKKRDDSDVFPNNDSDLICDVCGGAGAVLDDDCRGCSAGTIVKRADL